MILDTLQNSALYNAISPRMARAFELIAGTDWTTVEPGITNSTDATSMST